VSAAGDSVTGMPAPVLAVPQSELDDLRDRLERTRWPQTWPGTSDIGTRPEELRRLVDLWAHGFDWRAREAAINALPSHVAVIDGVDVHYLRYDAEKPGALPIVITHGWPSSVLELEGLAERLSSPSRFGGSAEDSFTVIVPSLPGFAFSPQRESLLDDLPTHEIWHRLMHDELGFERYAAHGGDLGAGISARLAEAHPESVVGIHVLAVADPRQYDPASVTDEEQRYLDAAAEWSAAEGAYQHQQSTRPMTLAFGLSDSPVGLLAWLLEKYRAWSEARLDDDFVLTQASLYWFTNTISTSFRPYYEFGRGSTVALTRVDVPTAVAVFPADLTHPPRSWAERSYAVARYTRMPRGGHFAAREQPELLADDIAAFFADLG
jgi:pimeloyl-ACP methyl ester carboxylesterase